MDPKDEFKAMQEKQKKKKMIKKEAQQELIALKRVNRFVVSILAQKNETPSVDRVLTKARKTSAPP